MAEESNDSETTLSDWMSKLPAPLPDTPLFEIAIPGKYFRF